MTRKWHVWWVPFGTRHVCEGVPICQPSNRRVDHLPTFPPKGCPFAALCMMFLTRKWHGMTRAKYLCLRQVGRWRVVLRIWYECSNLGKAMFGISNQHTLRYHNFKFVWWIANPNISPKHQPQSLWIKVTQNTLFTQLVSRHPFISPFRLNREFPASAIFANQLTSFQLFP